MLIAAILLARKQNQPVSHEVIGTFPVYKFMFMPKFWVVSLVFTTRVAFQNPSPRLGASLPRHQGWLTLRPANSPCTLQALQKRLSVLEQRTLPSLEQALETHRSTVHSQASLPGTGLSLTAMPGLPLVCGAKHGHGLHAKFACCGRYATDPMPRAVVTQTTDSWPLRHNAFSRLSLPI